MFRPCRKPVPSLRTQRRQWVRKCLVEQLEDRRLMAVDGWNNVLQPLSVLGDPNQGVSPLDALVIINEINGPQYSGPNGRLPDQPPPQQRPPYFDVNCNGSVDPLDVLLVINHLNGGAKPTSWSFASSGNASGAGFVSAASCSPQLNEGSSLKTEIVTSLIVPDANSAVRVTFRQPVFDTASVRQMHDAFEIVALDTSGNPLVLPYAPQLEAVANWSENSPPSLGPAAQWVQSQTDWLATINLTGIAAGTRIQLAVRLLNNDSDTSTHVIVRGIEFVPATGPNPTGTTWDAATALPTSPLPWTRMQDVTGSVQPNYSRTTYTQDRDSLFAEVAFENLGTLPVSSAIAVVDNLSDLSIVPTQPDGYLDDGRAYYRILSDHSDGMLVANGTSSLRRIRFDATGGRQFSFTWKVYGVANEGRVSFLTTPVDTIENGNVYRYQAAASSTLGGPMRYTILSGPANASISETTGALTWSTTDSDVGRHALVIRAIDAYGFEATQSFQLWVRTSLVNRPPIFTSTPETDATISSPYEVQTYATGLGPEAATLLPSRSGLKHVVTANRDDNNLGILPSGPFVLGASEPIDLGERPASESKDLFEGPSAIELGLIPNTVGKNERDVQQVLAEDIDGDGNPDAVALVSLRGSGNWNDSNDRGFLIARLGNGDGSFREGWQVALPTVAGRIGRGATLRFADVTSDGRKDFVVTTIATNQILVYPGTGSGAFDSNPITSPTTGNYVGITQLEDMNRDGKLDLVLFENVQVQIGGRQAISIYQGDGSGRFTESALIASTNNNGGNGYIVDVDGVNGPDIVRLNYTDVRLETYLNDGSGGFGARIDSDTKSFYGPGNPSGSSFNTTSASFGDFDGDGYQDAVLTGAMGVVLLRGQGNGRFGNGTASGSTPLVPWNNEWFGLSNSTGRAIDLNGDSHPDFVFGNISDFNNVLVGLGRGDGTFAMSQYNTAFESDIGIGIVKDSQPTISVSTADFNRDGVMDAVLGNAFRVDRPGSIGLLLGDHPGSFRAPQSLRNFDYANGGSPTTFNMRDSVSGDFNNDGFLDLVTYGGIGFDGGFYFAPGRGDGTFGKYEIVFGGLNQYGINSLTVLDIDRDGKLDLAWLQDSLSRQAFGLGNGSFQALPSVSVPGSGGNFQNALQVDDFNGDSYPDIVHRLQTGNIDSNFITRLVVLLYDPANRRYNTLPDVNDTITNWPRAGGYYWDESLGIGDLNGDGKKEFFAYSRSIPSSNIPSRWVVIEQTGGPASDASTLFRKTVIENPSFIPHDRAIDSYVVDDFNGDGINDVAYTGNHVQTTVMLGNGDFTFRDPTSYYTHTFQLDSGDFNGDGITDLVSMWGWGFYSYSSRPYQSVLYGRGDGTFSEMNGFTAVANVNLVAVGDFNGDGQDDLAGTPNGNQGVAFLSRPAGVSDVASGDLNGDGTSDLVSIISGIDRVKVNTQKFDGTFQRTEDLFTGLLPVAIDLLDVDDNGMLDIVTANRQGRSISILSQTSRGQFSRSDLALPIRPSDMQLGDVNRDGIQDIVILSQVDRSLVVLAGTGLTLSLSLVLPLGFSPNDLSVGDVTNDGIIDVALTDGTGDRIVVLPGRGDGTFASPITVLGVASPGDLAIADMNRDGRQDLVIAQPDNDRVGVLYQRGQGKFTTPQWIKAGQKPGELKADDVNGDGATDILVVNRDDNTVSLILNRFDPNRVWTYQPTANDPDGDDVAFDLLDAPGGMLLDPSTNTLYWAPMPEQLGVNPVILEASDGRGGSTQQGFQVIVTAPVANVAPQFTSTPITQVTSDAEYRYQPNIVQQVPTSLRYSLVQAPEGMTVDPTTGELQWDPRTYTLKLNEGARNNGSIEVPDAPSLRPASVTAEGWFYFEDPKGALYENLLSKRASATNPNLISFGLEYYYGNLRAKVGTPASNNSLATVMAPAPIEFQKWTHVAMTFEDASRILTLYVNGEAVGTALSPEGIGYNESPVQSGRNIAGLARQRIWNRALTPSEIQEGMLADVPRDAAGLVLQWNFQESRDATTILDSSSSRNHGYLVGTPDWVSDFPKRLRGLASQGSHDVILRVEDGNGGFAEQSFRIDVVPPFLRRVSGVVFSDLDGDREFDVPVTSNVIANPNFTSGIGGWETEFFPRPEMPGTGWLGDAQVTVARSSNVAPLSGGYSGHTNGANEDLMLIANGDAKDRVVWRQRVAVMPGQDYDFSFWALRPSGYEAATLEARWNGQRLGATFTLSDIGEGNWKQFRQRLTSTGGQGILEIVSLGSTLPPNPGLGTVENSFAIDDLLLVPAFAKRVVVPGTANPYLAGMPNGSTAYGSTAPQGSPPAIDVQPGQVLRIRATGHTRSDGFITTRSPDGSVTNTTGMASSSANGISQYSSPNHGSLLGVFLNDQSPSGQPAPAGLDFRTVGNVPGGIDYLSISPLLRQLFFIGDGFTSSGTEQTIVVPQGATRLFLANSSNNSWTSNPGAFEVQVFTDSGEPVQSGRTVFLDANRNQAYDAGEPTAITDARGRYALSSTGDIAYIGLIGQAGQLQSVPTQAVVPVDLNAVTPTRNFGSRSAVLEQPPVFLSQPMTTATAPGSYLYSTFAQSPKGQQVTYALASGPQGMTLDPVSGILQWSPLASQAGTHDILIQAFDTDRQFTIQRYSLTVTINTSPIITSTAPATSHPGIAWQYRLRAQDAESSQLTYRLVSGPTGMTLGSQTGVVTYVPPALGAFSFEVEVSDGQGGMSRQPSSVTVVPAGSNEPPRDLRGASGAAIIDRIFASQLEAFDDNHEPLAFSLVNGPAGMTVSSEGQLFWEPSEPGQFPVTVAATDTRGGRVETTGAIHVYSRAPRSALTIDSSPTTAARVGLLYSYDVVAPNAILFELIDAPVGMSIDAQHGTIRWIPTKDALGVHTFQLRCTDLFGNIATQKISIAVRSSSLVPTISSAPPTEASVGRTYLYSVRTDNPSQSPLQFELVVAPNGMNLDSQSGEVTWTPSAQQVGPTTVLLRVSDGLGNFSTQSYAIMVAAGAFNRPPAIQSIAGTDAVVGQPFVYTLQATDPENAAVTYGVRSGPAGFAIHPTTGVVTWTPQSSQVGTISIVLTASDPQGGVAVQSLSIDVRAANRAPEIRSNPVLSVSQGGMYQYDVLAIDPDREPLTYELLQAPAGMTIDPLGRIRWQTQLNTPLGGRIVSLRVRDGLGATSVQSFTFGVVADTQAPRLTIVVSGEPVLYPWTVSPAIVRVIATDNVALASVELRVDGVPVELAPDGTARVYFSGPGNGRLVATATDAAGNQGTSIGRVNMRSGEEDGSGNPAPEASITSVGSGATVRGFVDILGTAAAPDFASYRLSYRRVDQTEYTLIRESQQPVSAASLGRWDTTLLENDNYVLKLEVIDTFGSFAGVEVEVSVTGNLKLGNFRLSFEDMTIPVAGIPITIVRTYDTLRADREGDFGYGWRMEYRNTDLRTNLPKSGLEDLGIYTPFKQGTRVFLTLPGGTRQGFTFTPEYKVLPGFGMNNNLVVAFPKFTSDQGVTSTLSAGSGALIANAFGELYASGGIPWNPASPDFGGYTLTTQDGMRYQIDGASGLMTSATDRNGNTLILSDDGIRTSSGNTSIAIERDAQGRIRALVDPTGNTVRYDYSSLGDLSSVMDREGNTTQLRYRTDRPHYLDSIIDPLGRTGIRTEYGPDGRLVRAIDAGGNSSQTLYDLDNDLVISQDARGNPTTVEYDPHGNIVREIDSLGGVISYTYDSNNRMISRTDPGSGTTRFSYDTLGRETERILSNGSSFRWTYNNLGDVVTSTNPLGQTTRYEYDSQGNRAAVIDPTGSRTQFAHDSRGLLLRTTDALGYVTENTYDAAGRQVAIRQADGSLVTFAVDGLGNPTEASTTLSTSSGSINVTVSTTRNANGRLLTSTDALGKTTHYSYDAAGQPTAILRPGQQPETVNYDALGRPVSLVSANGVTTAREYDPVGNIIASTTAGIRSQTTFDALGRPTEVNIPGGETIMARFDAAGRPIDIQRGENTPRTMAYDGVGQLVGTSTMTGGNIATYDAAGRVVSRTDSNGTTTYVYDAAGRIARVTDPFGASTITTYDARGQVIAITDADNRTTKYAYDGMKRLIEVVDASGSRTKYGYDELGRLTSETDAIGRVTRNEYDLIGRRVALIQPDGTRQTFTYDESGRLIGTVNAEGQSTQFEYDSRGFLSRRISTTETVAYTRNQVGLPTSVTDSRGTARVEYDSNYRITRRTEADGRWVAYTYDSVGRVVRISSPNNAVQYTYDGEGRVNSITDASGGATRVNYDTQGRAIAWIYPNGISEVRTYDSANRIATLRIVEGTMTIEERRYTYDFVGRLTLSEQVGIGTTAYQYDAVDRLTVERFTPLNGVARETSYTYDAVGNRLSRRTASGTEYYQYDLGGRLVSVTGVDPRTYSYDGAGRVLREDRSTNNFTTYTWDSDDRLIQARVVSPSGTKQVDYLYDPAGNLVRRTEDGVIENYLVDANRPLAEIFEVNNSATGTTRYAYRPDGILSSSDSQGRRYLHTDRQGTTYASSDSNGAIVSLPSSDAFGRAEGASGHFFAGQRRDPLTGLDENRARRYDPDIGRFLSRDAFAGRAVDPMSQQDYLYANASPTNGSDPTGFFTVSDLTTSNYITQLLIGSLSQGIVGAGLSIAKGGAEWSGPTIGVQLGIDSFGAMLLTSEPTKEMTTTKLLQISIAEGLQTPDIFGAVRDAIKSTPLNGSSFPGIAEQFVSVGFDLLLSGGDRTITIGNSSMWAPSVFGTGLGALGAFLGGYVSAGLSVQGGVLLALPAIAYGMLTLLNSGSFEGANGLGVSVTVAGFSTGYSTQDITLTNAGSIGFSLSVGISFALPIHVNQKIKS